MGFSGGQHHTLCLSSEGNTFTKVENIKWDVIPKIKTPITSMRLFQIITLCFVGHYSCKISKLVTYRIMWLKALDHVTFTKGLKVLLSFTGQVYSLGRAEYGRLGLGKDATEKSEPTPVTGISDAQVVACGASVSYSVTKQGMNTV